MTGRVPTSPARSFSEATLAAARDLVARYPQPRSALLPLLHLVQAEEGYVSDEGMALCSRLVDLTMAEVQAVATFYTMFKREPVGDWLVSVCTNVSCKVAGGQAIYDRYRELLDGHRDEEAGVTVEHVECLGICDEAPVVQVNYDMYGRLTAETADDLLAAVRAGRPPTSLSGAAPRTFREVQWELSGADDGQVLHKRAVVAAAADLTAPEPPADRLAEATEIPLTPGGKVRPEPLPEAAPEDRDGEDEAPTDDEGTAPDQRYGGDPDLDAPPPAGGEDG